MAEPVTFLATIRPIQSALSVSGNNDGARLVLDIPETELPAIARLLLLRGVVLKVTVEEDKPKPKPAPAKPRVKRWNERRA